MVATKVALITAGGSGLGAAAARRLAADGYQVAILSSSGKGEALAKELGGLGVTGSNLEVADLKKLVDLAMERWGRVDVLVNSAGHGPKGAVLEISDEDWHLGMDYYLLNVIRPTRLVTPIMAKQGGGTIVNVSTFAAFEPDPLFPTSGVFRAGLAAFAKLFADKYAADNVRMNNILPGFIDSLPEKEDRRARIPMGRYGKEKEFSALVSYLASDDAAYMTGQNLRLDGGLTRSV
ncbi:MAG: SDR family oxidoreductase [Alphaproteobacteria bacterium]|jgi:NAD(P)-dependent dehydrogenase (short-subunit alcohol dehydrogenase family)|nr:SDR family oxidoreductase [Alphaproteobacteria bacterium]MBU0804780.1 SDR family oxidoreductase [Alphaproteobacteria bacterium]MBU0871727.1 SDR family oxidoreductase [Alphaproteobacteria bacterium]MBU1403480.1 SDR family oxidoreductase [Alphaproteobacteria bacterium]MBU1591456.1 SDR family oxidoreductase [Alphaproteobacteria bacterium]